MLFLLNSNRSYAATNSPLINRIVTDYWNTSRSFHYYASNFKATNYYKFLVTVSNQNPIMVIAGTNFVESWMKFIVYNAGSIDEITGYSLSRMNIPSISSFTTEIWDSTRTAIIGNIGPVNSGTFSTYYIRIKIPPSVPVLKFTNTAKCSNLTPAFPARILITNAITIVSQAVYVLSASDGIHEVTGPNLMNTNLAKEKRELGNIDAKITVYLRSVGPLGAFLYYDVDAIPDGSPPNKTLNKNRRVALTPIAGGYYFAVISQNDPEIKPGKRVNFIITDGYYGNIWGFEKGDGKFYSYELNEYLSQSEEEGPLIIADNYGDFRKTPVKLIYLLSLPSHVNITVYNIRGEIVRILKNETETGIGKHAVVWDGKNDAGRECAHGLYFLHVETNIYSATKKAVFVKR